MWRHASFSLCTILRQGKTSLVAGLHAEFTLCDPYCKQVYSAATCRAKYILCEPHCKNRHGSARRAEKAHPPDTRIQSLRIGLCARIVHSSLRYLYPNSALFPDPPVVFPTWSPAHFFFFNIFSMMRLSMLSLSPHPSSRLSAKAGIFLSLSSFHTSISLFFRSPILAFSITSQPPRSPPKFFFHQTAPFQLSLHLFPRRKTRLQRHLSPSQKQKRLCRRFCFM